MTIFAGAADLLEITGATTRCRRRRWGRAWSLWGPLLLIAAGLGMLAGAAIVAMGG